MISEAFEETASEIISEIAEKVEETFTEESFAAETTIIETTTVATTAETTVTSKKVTSADAIDGFDAVLDSSLKRTVASRAK